jgi:thiamine transport system permease protein
VDDDRAALIDVTPIEPGHNRLSAWAVLTMAAVPAGLFAAFYAAPLATLVITSARPGSIRELAEVPGLGGVVWFTLWQATVSTALTVLLGMPLTGLLSRYRFTGRAVLLAVVTVPFMLPAVVTGASFSALLPQSWQPGALAMIAAHAWVNLAVIVRVVGPAWQSMPLDQTGAAATLGAGRWQAARHVVLPQLRGPLLSAATIVFVLSFTSFGIARVLGGAQRATLEVEINRRALQLGDVDGAAVLVVAQLMFLLMCAVIGGRFAGLSPVHGLNRGATSRPLGGRHHHRLLVACLTVALAAPLVALVVASLRVDGQLSMSGWRTGISSGRPTTVARVDPYAALGASLRYAVVAAALASVAGTMHASVVAAVRRRGRRSRWLDAVLVLPLATSAVSIGLGLLITFDVAPIDLRDEWVMIPIGHALLAAPFVSRAVTAHRNAQGDSLLAAAATLGASPWRAWWHVEIRGSATVIAAGAGLAAAVSLGDFGASSILSRSGSPTAPMAVAQLLGRPAALARAQGFAMATMLAVVTGVLVVAADRRGALDARRS